MNITTLLTVLLVAAGAVIVSGLLAFIFITMLIVDIASIAGGIVGKGDKK